MLRHSSFFDGIYYGRGVVNMKRNDCSAAIGVCALALGLGILIAAVFPVGALMFVVSFLLIACGCCCLKR